ncbi:hypothetical protein B1H18_22605 [Streptomyces tsukubensis]|uniref:PPM-type phosphatase domain-containing protein n=1 Tax=Streptomyces tsukubensis TaxID=83656 RepID=A0A1V4A4L9_9ACTN|nr:hypothetical protein B1H18_22605 [Streptomyces tsukubensis]
MGDAGPNGSNGVRDARAGAVRRGTAGVGKVRDGRGAPGVRARRRSQTSVGGGPGSDGAGILVRVLPPLLIVGGFLFDILTPPRFTGSPFYSAAPLIAAPFFALPYTAFIGVMSCVAGVVLHTLRGNLDEAQSILEIVTVFTVCVLAVLINLLIRRSGEELASVRNVAEAAQRAVLPVPAERIAGLHIAAMYEAAEADAFIGGDLYAVQDTPHGVRLVVGDVRGKGLGAVEAVAVVIGSFREAAEQETSLEAVAQRLDRALAREGTRRDGLDAFEGFTTAVLAEIPHSEGTVRVLNRGHPEPLLLLADGRLRVLSTTEHALPLGMTELGAWPDRSEPTAFPPGATLLFFTDGVSEARDADGVFYDPVARLVGRVFVNPDELLATVADEVRVHTGGGAMDDMALLAIRRP